MRWIVSVARLRVSAGHWGSRSGGFLFFVSWFCARRFHRPESASSIWREGTARFSGTSLLRFRFFFLFRVLSERCSVLFGFFVSLFRFEQTLTSVVLEFAFRW